jgi:hypothetical protein
VRPEQRVTIGRVGQRVAGVQAAHQLREVGVDLGQVHQLGHDVVQRLGGERADTARLALRARPRQPLDDEWAHPGQGQLGCQQQPDRSRSDDEHIRVHGTLLPERDLTV